MDAISAHYTDLDTAIDEVRVLVDRWADQVRPNAHERMPDGQTLRYTQLVLHEWLANLAQHASFPDPPPVIRIHLRAEQRHVYCTVEDNSTGFDVDAHLDLQETNAEALPERGMGLRIIHACTDSFAYHSTDQQKYRFEFSIPADHDPWLSTLF